MCSGWQTAFSSCTHRSRHQHECSPSTTDRNIPKKVFVRATLPTEEGSLLIAEWWIYGPGHMSSIRWVVNLCVMGGEGEVVAQIRSTNVVRGIFPI